MTTETTPAPDRRDDRATARQRAARLRLRQRQLLFGGGGLVAVLLLLGVTLLVMQRIRTTQHAQETARQQANVPLTVDGIQCLGSESLEYHIHAHLALFQDGKPVTLPAYIGIPVSPDVPMGNCFYWLHVHDTSGLVHIESPTVRTYTLGQFFNVWQRTAQLDAQGAVMYRVDDTYLRALRAAKPEDIHVFVGDQPVADYASIPLTAHELITVEIGGPVQPPDTAYTFPQGQ